MNIRKKINLLILAVFFVLLISSLVVMVNYRNFTRNTQLQKIIHDSIHDLNATSLLLDEFLIKQNDRIRYQLRRQATEFRVSDSFSRLAEYSTTYDLVPPLIEKKKDFLVLLDSFFLLLEESDSSGPLFEETASLLFVFSHEMKSCLSVLHGRVQAHIARDNLFFVGSSVLLLIIISGLLLSTFVWIRRGFLERILRMDRLAGQIAHGDYSNYLPIEKDDEITGLARSFTVMQDAVHEQMDHLASERDKFRTILNSIEEAVIAVNERAEILIMNPVAERLTSWKFKEAVGRFAHEVFRLFSPGTREPLKNPLQYVLGSGESAEYSGHAVLVNRSGMEYLIQESASPVLNKEGSVVGAVLVFRDISNQAQMQEAMAQNEKMQSVGVLAAGIAQEINSPLSDLFLCVESLAESTDPEGETVKSLAEVHGFSLEDIGTYLRNSGVLQHVSTIREESAWVMRILEKMLMFAGMKTDSMEQADITNLLDNAIELAKSDYELKNLYDFRKIIIVRDYQKNLPSILCDKVGLQQVFLNILRNGVQAMYSAKTDAPRFLLRISHDEEQSSICVEITDNGPGMEESVRKRAFEPFYSTRDKGTGSGLGLSIAYFIISDTHGGTIEVRSPSGSGARFIIHLPLAGHEQ